MKRRWIGALLILCLLMGPARGEMQLTPEEFEENFAPYCQWDGTTLTLRKGIVTLGEYLGDDVETENSWITVTDPKVEAVFQSNPAGNLWFSWEFFSFSRVVWPESIRMLGAQSFHLEHFSELTIPKQMEKLCPDAFIYCSFDTLRIEAALPWEQIADATYDCTVYAWDVPADHPLYTVRDGALYTKDGETLLDYPNGRTDAHWDVPAGTKRIDHICNENLKTLSLPIGLETLDDYAFSGCTRLQSIALPLTVKSIGVNIFSDCVSLDLVSLPNGVSMEKSSWAEYYAQDGLFHGDNGDTGSDETTPIDRKWPNEWLNCGARLIGDGPVILYQNSKGEETAGELPPGISVFADETKDGRIKLCTITEERTLGWAEIRRVRLLDEEALFPYANALLPNGEDPRDSVKHAYFEVDVYGPWVLWWWETVTDSGEASCRIRDAILYRSADSGPGPLGVTVSPDGPDDPVPLLASPGGAALESLYEGDQIKIIAEEKDYFRVFTGFEEGWLPRENVKIVPILEEGNNQ